MESVLENVNAVPGVVGCMLCDPQGRLVAQAFPAPFEDAVLQEAAAALADGSLGLETVTGPMGLVDLRYESARILAKPLAGALLLLLCTRSVNLQLVSMSVSVAGRRFEQLMARAEAQAPTASQAASQRPGGRVPDEQIAEPAAQRSDRPAPEKKMSWWPSV